MNKCQDKKCRLGQGQKVKGGKAKKEEDKDKKNRIKATNKDSVRPKMNKGQDQKCRVG